MAAISQAADNKKENKTGELADASTDPLIQRTGLSMVEFSHCP